MESIEKAEGPMISRREVGVRKWPPTAHASRVSSANIRPLRCQRHSPIGRDDVGKLKAQNKLKQAAHVIYSTPSR